MTASDPGRIGLPALAGIATDILTAAGASPENARLVADALADADAAGRASHGTRQVAAYVDKLLAGDVDGQATPSVIDDRGAVVRIDGRRAFGQVVGLYAADLGAGRAREHGICMVAIENGSHFGRNALWPERAAATGVASMHFGHGFGAAPSVAPHGGAEPRLRTTPIAFGTPGPDGDPIVLDFSVAQLSFNSVKVLAERGERLPPGAAIAADGAPSDDPAAVLSGAAALLPFGGFKGYGLAVFGEIFGGIIAAGNARSAGVNAMLSIYFDVGAVADADYGERVAAMVASLRSTPALPGASVSVPGDRGRRARAEAARDGIAIAPALRRGLLAAADRAGVAPEVRQRWPLGSEAA